MPSSQMNSQVNAFQRHFVADIKRCDEMERKTRFLHDQLIKDDGFEPTAIIAPASASPSLPLDQLEARLEQEEQDLYDGRGGGGPFPCA